MCTELLFYCHYISKLSLLTLFVVRFIVCQLQCQPDVWQFNLWRRPVLGAGRHSPVRASLPRLRVDCSLSDWWSAGHCTQTCSGASHPFPPVSYSHIKARVDLQQSHSNFDVNMKHRKWRQIIPSVHRWFFKSCAESILIGDGKSTCDFPLHFGKCLRYVNFSYVHLSHTIISSLALRSLC